MKITLTELVNLQNETTAVNAINTNSSAIETAIDNTLSRDGSGPNQMESSLDMNSNRILNLPAAVTGTDPVRKEEIDNLILTGNLPDFLLPMNLVNGGTAADLSASGGYGAVLQQDSSGAPITSGTIYNLSPTVRGLATNVSSLSITGSQQVMRTSGYSTLGIGEATYKRVATQPTHTGRLRSADRYLPNGTINNTNGGWWEISESPLNVFMFGAVVSNSNAANKTALQTAISVCDAQGIGAIIVPYPINYGYVKTDRATHPDFTGCVSDMYVYDYGIGASYPAPAKEGAQMRTFFYTAQTTPIGQHDGNGVVLEGSWHPYLWLENTLVTSGLASDNIRTSLYYGYNGLPVWQIGIGQTEVGAVPVDRMKHYVISGFDASGSPKTTPILLNLETGANNYSTGTSATKAAHWFKHEPIVTNAFPTVLVENSLGDATLTLRNSIGADVDTSVSNHAGAWRFTGAVTVPVVSSGARPTGVTQGAQVFDNSLGIPIWYNGTAWISAAGVLV